MNVRQLALLHFVAVSSFRVDNEDDARTITDDVDVQSTEDRNARENDGARASQFPAQPPPQGHPFSMTLKGTRQAFAESMRTGMYESVPQELLIARRCRPFTVTVGLGPAGFARVEAPQPAATTTTPWRAAPPSLNTVSSYSSPWAFGLAEILENDTTNYSESEHNEARVVSLVDLQRTAGNHSTLRLADRESPDPGPPNVSVTSAPLPVRQAAREPMAVPPNYLSLLNGTKQGDESSSKPGFDHTMLRDQKTLGIKDGDEVIMKVSGGRLIVETLRPASLKDPPQVAMSGASLNQADTEDELAELPARQRSIALGRQRARNAISTPIIEDDSYSYDYRGDYGRRRGTHVAISELAREVAKAAKDLFGEKSSNNMAPLQAGFSLLQGDNQEQVEDDTKFDNAISESDFTDDYAREWFRGVQETHVEQDPAGAAQGDKTDHSGHPAVHIAAMNEASAQDRRQTVHEDDNFDELATRLETSNQIREATENTKVECMSGPGSSDITLRLVQLRRMRHKMNEECGLPRGIPCYVAIGDIVCRGAPHQCRLQSEKKRSCCEPQVPVEREIRACQARKVALQVASDPSMAGGDHGEDDEHSVLSTVEGSVVADQVNYEADVQRKALLRKQYLQRRAQRQDFWRTQEYELYNWKPPADAGLRMNQQPHFNHPTLIDAGANNRGSTDGDIATDNSVPPWARTLSFQFAAMDTDMNTKPVWYAQSPIVPGSCTQISCDYTATIPCNAVVGRGVLSARLQGQPNIPAVELPERLFVIFDPWSQGDEFYANLSQVEMDANLLQEDGGIWAASNEPVRWNFGQFAAPTWQMAMMLLDDIPLSQRSMGPRVARWITYFLPTMLQGRWCSPPTCFDDGIRPWAWPGSKDLFLVYLQTRQPVKYAQCWVFAGSAVSLYRSMGIASRAVSNYNSAHGSTKNDGGVDSFYFYADGYQLSARSTPKNSIWSFHVWSEIFMRRLDLGYPIADGWQVADPTPQEEACVPTPGGKTACRFMMGPASVNLARLGPNSPSILAHYDTKFLVGETFGSLRSWRPVYVNWKTCPVGCARQAIGDGNCDRACNIKACDFDMGDCCPATCAGVLPVRELVCGGTGYECKGMALGWTMLYLPDRTYIGSSITTQQPGGAWNQPMDITRTYKMI